MGIFSNAQENQFEEIKGRNLLSNNELSLYKYLLDGCDRDNLQATFSLDKLSADLNLAVNTVKSCREKLKDLGLITFERLENSTTTYYIRDTLKDPIPNGNDTDQEIDDVELNENRIIPDTREKESSQVEPVNISSIKDYDLSFIEPSLLPAYKTLLLSRISYGKPLTQTALLEMYSAYIGTNMNLDSHKQEIFIIVHHFVEDQKKNAMLGNFDFSFVDDELRSDFESFIIDKISMGHTLTQEKIFMSYSDAISASMGDAEIFVKNLKIS
jgi:hypothetical protein